MEKELSHSFNAVLDKEFSKKLFHIQQKLKEKIVERRNYDSSPHLAIATKFMGESDTDNFANALIREFSNDQKWELRFTNFSPSETGNYIFLNLDKKSKEIIFTLHERAFSATKNIGSEGQGGLPPKYAYDPHISIIKLQPAEVSLAMEIISEDFSKITTSVESYEITRQKDNDNGFSDFPVIQEILNRGRLIIRE